MKNSDFKVRCEPRAKLVISFFIRLGEFCYGWTGHVKSADSHHGRLVSGAYQSLPSIFLCNFPNVRQLPKLSITYGWSGSCRMPSSSRF